MVPVQSAVGLTAACVSPQPVPDLRFLETVCSPSPSPGTTLGPGQSGRADSLAVLMRLFRRMLRLGLRLWAGLDTIQEIPGSI